MICGLAIFGKYSCVYMYILLASVVIPYYPHFLRQFCNYKSVIPATQKAEVGVQLIMNLEYD